MLGDSLQGLAFLASIPVVVALLIGIGWGYLISLMPGVGGVVAMALLLPFIVGMSVPAAMALMLGAHVATIFGTSITSILLNIPGGAKSVPLCWDGYPMTVSGQAARALGASAFSSGVGGLIGAVILTVSLPLLRLALEAIGPGEIFLMGVWGLTIIAVFSEGSLLKGIAAAGLGVLLSWIGEDPVTGVSRFTFGSIYLQDGLQFPTIAMGLFAVAQMLKLFVRGTPTGGARDGSVGSVGSVFDGIRDVIRHWKLTLHMAIFGVITGIVPGIGAPIAAIGAYGQAVELSREPEKFGTGKVEGVIAPQATDAASEGGGMLPLLGLGIPAHEHQAVLLVAFVILGIAPGQQMITQQLPLVFSIIWIIVFAYLIVTALGLVAAPHLAKISTLPTRVLIPAILCIAFAGAFAIEGSILDVIVAAVFGLVGFFLDKYKFSRADLVIGFVLGPILESHLHIASNLYGNLFFITRPAAAVISVLIVVTLGWTVWRGRHREHGAGPGSPSGGVPEPVAAGAVS